MECVRVAAVVNVFEECMEFFCTRRDKRAAELRPVPEQGHSIGYGYKIVYTEALSLQTICR